MAMNSEAAGKSGGNGGDKELEKPVTAVEHRLGIIEKTMVTAEAFQRELGAVRGAIAALRDTLSDEIAGVRDEIAGTREALRGEIAGVRDEVGALRVDIAKIPFETVKWLAAFAGIAAAIATAVYNIWFR